MPCAQPIQPRWIDAKRPIHIAGPLRCVEPDLLDGAPMPDDKIGMQIAFCKAGYGSRQFRRLIVPPLALPRPMQGHRHQNRIGTQKLMTRRHHHPRAEQRNFGPVGIFHLRDQFSRQIGIGDSRTRPGKRRWIGNRLNRKRTLAHV